MVIDRHDKRRIITITSAVMFGAALCLGALVLTDHVTTPLVYLLAAVLGLANTFDNPARRTLVNDLVPEDEVANAVALNSTLITVARILGPAFAGALIATVGIGWCFVLNGLSFIPVLVGLRRMDAATFRSKPVARAKGQLRAGLRYAASIDELRVPLILMAVIGTLAFNLPVLLPLLAERELHGSDVIDTRFLAQSALLLGASSAALAVAPSIVAAGVILLPAGYAAIGVLSGGNIVLQLATSAEMRGRVLALYTVVFLGSTPIGGPISGWTAERFGTPAGILLGAVASTAVGIAVLRFVRRRSALADDAAGLPDAVVAHAA